MKKSGLEHFQQQIIKKKFFDSTIRNPLHALTFHFSSCYQHPVNWNTQACLSIGWWKASGRSATSAMGKGKENIAA